jgi:hypothetical protein
MADPAEPKSWLDYTKEWAGIVAGIATAAHFYWQWRKDRAKPIVSADCWYVTWEERSYLRVHVYNASARPISIRGIEVLRKQWLKRSHVCSVANSGADGDTDQFYLQPYERRSFQIDDWKPFFLGNVIRIRYEPNKRKYLRVPFDWRRVSRWTRELTDALAATSVPGMQLIERALMYTEEQNEMRFNVDALAPIDDPIFTGSIGHSMGWKGDVAQQSQEAFTERAVSAFCAALPEHFAQTGHRNPELAA